MKRSFLRMAEVLDASSSPRSPSGSTLRGDGFEYDVFLSFRGTDTRKGFTGHLYDALEVRGVKTFIDSEKLEKGQKVEELFGYIERSKVFVPVFSKDCADSKWCLKEIAKMVDCRRLIIPVFFDVEPRNVRHQTGPFTPAFKSYRKKGKMDIEEVSKWADALRQVGGISGYNLADTEGDQAKLIRLIVKRILTEVNKAEVHKASLFVAKHGVGLDSRIADVMKVLELEARDDVKMVGICAMGGMGKTTVAKAVYNQISSHFGACCFIANVRETAGQPSGLVSLQKQFLRRVCKDETLDITSIDEGIGLIKERIQGKKILLILDDVDHESQLDALAGGLDWFGSGSRIIVTTRDKRVLRAPRVKEKGIYELKELDAAQSLQLFSWHAFGAAQPVDDFAELAKEVAGTAGGLPLALTIFGSHFFDLKTVKEWRIMLEKLKEDQDKDIHERLKISLDALDVKEKKIFLDIACFFIEEQRELATLMWEDCRLFPEIAIKVLVHKSLININDDTGKFGMHDHIRDMGRKIVQDESLYNPGMCSSRLWNDDETIDALQNMKVLKKLKVLNLSYCDSLKICPDFTSMPHLEKLNFGGCKKLSRLHPSIWYLKCLTHLSLHGCVSLKELPQEVGQLASLQVLCLGLCEGISTLPHSLGNLRSLRELDFSFTAIEELPDSMLLLENLEVLNLFYCDQLKVSLASVLIRLMVLKNCNGVLSVTTTYGSPLRIDDDVILHLLPSPVTELSDPDDPKLDSIAKKLESLDLEETFWLIKALAIDESELLETRRLGISLDGLLRKRFLEANFQHLLNWLNLESLDESWYARSLYLVLPEWFARGTLVLILDECSQLDSVVVRVDITCPCDGRSLFQTSTQAGAWRFDVHDVHNDYYYLDYRDDLVDWNEVPEVKLEWHDDGCLPWFVMMHVSISGCHLIDGYLRCSHIDDAIPNQIGQSFVVQYPQQYGHLVVLELAYSLGRTSI